METQLALKTVVVSLLKNVNRLTEKAPIKIPGAIALPANSRIAKAKPDGGHTGVAFEFLKDNKHLKDKGKAVKNFLHEITIKVLNSIPLIPKLIRNSVVLYLAVNVNVCYVLIRLLF